MTSGCLFIVGYFATVYVPNIEVCILTYGIIAGMATFLSMLFVVIADGVVLCDSRNQQPWCSLYFLSFEISGNILRNQKISYVKTHLF